MKTKTTKTKTKEVLFKEKALLEKQLQAIKAVEEKEAERKFDDLLEAIKPEFDLYKSLVCFKKKSKITIELSYDIDLCLCDHNLHHPKREDLGDIEGDCAVRVKEPKGYNITPFIHEDSFCNTGMEDYWSLIGVDPDLKTHCNKFLNARAKLINKIVKTAKKLGLDETESIEKVQDSIYK